MSWSLRGIQEFLHKPIPNDLEIMSRHGDLIVHLCTWFSFEQLVIVHWLFGNIKGLPLCVLSNPPCQPRIGSDYTGSSD